MDITFKCVHCQQSIDAPPEAAGALCDCPNCQKEITVPLASDPAPAPVVAPAQVATAVPKGTQGKFTVGSKKQMMRSGSSAGTASAAPVPQAKKKAGKGGVIVTLLIGVTIGYGVGAAQMLLGHGFGPKPGGGDGHGQVPVASTNGVPAVVADSGQVSADSTNTTAVGMTQE